MRTAVVAITIVTFGAACASAPTSGPMGEGSSVHPQVAVVDSAVPPHHVTVKLDQPGYLALLLIAPGHSATLLYPKDSATSNQFVAGSHRIDFQIPETLVESDSVGLVLRRDTTTRVPRPRVAGTMRTVATIPPATPTYLLIVTSPQQLHYGRIVEKTVGVSIPLLDTEALNAIGKAIKSTIASEPREWAGYYARVEVRRPR